MQYRVIVQHAYRPLGASIGVALSKSVQYTNDSDGLMSAFACMNATSMTYRNSKL